MSAILTHDERAAIKTIVAANEAADALDDNAKLSGTNVFTGAITTGEVFNVGAIPTADPVVAGQLWNNAGALAVSTGV